MSRLIDADRLHDCIMDNDIHSGIMSLKNVYEFIDEQPTIDAVPVVRCKDCKFYETKHYYKGICKNIIGMVDVKDGNSFCSYGERKEETE